MKIFGTSYTTLGRPAREGRTRGALNPPFPITRRELSGSRHFLLEIGAASLVGLMVAGLVWATLMTMARPVGVIDTGLYGDRAIVIEETLRNGKECRQWSNLQTNRQ